MVDLVRAITTARSNAELVEQAARLYAPDPARQTWAVLDPTYGRGKMWNRWQPANLVIHTLDVTQPLVVDGVQFDLVLFDPPYVAKGGRATTPSIVEHDSRYGREALEHRKTSLTVTEVERLMSYGMENCANVLKPGGMLWVKSADYVTSGKVVWGNHFVRTHGRALGLEHIDELYLRSNSPQPTVNRDGTPRRQVHARRGFSMLSVWRLPRG